MKKFSAKSIVALTAAMAIVTVGGVYATWYYTSTGSTSGIGGSLNLKVEGYVEDSAQGTYTVAIGYDSNRKDEDKKVYHVDQYTEAQNSTYYNGNYKIGTSYNDGTSAPTSPDNHTAALCVDSTSDGTTFTISFTAGSAAEPDVWNYGITTTVTLYLTGVGYYMYDATGDSWNYSDTYDASTAPYAMFSINDTAMGGSATTYTTSGANPVTYDAVQITINDMQTGGTNVWAADGTTVGKFNFTFTASNILSLVNLDYMVVEDKGTYDEFEAAAGSTQIAYRIEAVDTQQQ